MSAYNASLRWTYRNRLKIELAVRRTPLTTSQLGLPNRLIRSGSKLSHFWGKSCEAISEILSLHCDWIWGGTVHISSTRLFLIISLSESGTKNFLASSSSGSGAQPFLTIF